MCHDFRDWREVRHTDAVDEEVLVPARAGGQDGSDVVPPQLADLVEGAVLVACRIKCGHGEQDDGQKARGRGEGRASRVFAQVQDEIDQDGDAQQQHRLLHAEERQEHVAAEERAEDAAHDIDRIGPPGFARPSVCELVDQLRREVAEADAERDDAQQRQRNHRGARHQEPRIVQQDGQEDAGRHDRDQLRDRARAAACQVPAVQQRAARRGE